MSGRPLLALPLLLLLTSACAAEGDADDDVGDDGAPTEECLSGIEWVGGNTESPLMHPGLDCLGCHGDLGVEDEVVLGGTVFDAFTERDDCFGVPDVTVQITDSTNTVFELTSNASGNFFLEIEDEASSIVPPYSAKLLFEGRERSMLTMQTVLSCNSCHTQAGLNGAPGRILAP
jgi:hypothetical protein